MMRWSVVLGVLLAAGWGYCGPAPAATPRAGLSASFKPSGATRATGLVRLRGGAVSGDVIDIEVAIGGPTTAKDLYSVAFDLAVSDPAVVRLERATARGALTLAAGQTRTVQATLTGNHLVVGVTKLGGGAGNAITAREDVLVTLTLKVLAPGTATLTFAGGLAALDSSGRVVPSVRFDSKAATLTSR